MKIIKKKKNIYIYDPKQINLEMQILYSIAI